MQGWYQFYTFTFCRSPGAQYTLCDDETFWVAAVGKLCISEIMKLVLLFVGTQHILSDYEAPWILATDIR